MRVQRRYVSPLDLLHMTKSALRQTNNWKALIFAILSVLWSWALGLGPIALGIRAAVVSGSFWPALWVPVVVYLVYALYLAFWPVLALLNLIAVWCRDGFLVALLSTIANLLVLFALFGAPEWFMLLSYRYADKAAEFEEARSAKSLGYENEDDSEDYDRTFARAVDEPGQTRLPASVPGPAVNLPIVSADICEVEGSPLREQRGEREDVKIPLHEAIRLELVRHGWPMNSTELAAAINRTGSYVRRDGQPVRASQVIARVRKYDSLFYQERKGGRVLISLREWHEN